MTPTEPTPAPPMEVPSPPAVQTASEHAAPSSAISLGMLLRVWFGLSVQSFGGGVATLALIRQAVVEQHKWLPESEFARYWALVQAAPGINLLALTILIGRRLGGWRGIGVCMLGLLLPSVTITILLTAGYTRIQNLPLMRAVLRGIVPATVGVGLVTAIQMARPPLADSRREGAASFAVALSILFASALAAFWRHIPVVLILCAAGSVGAVLHWLRTRNKTNDPTEGSRS